MTASQGDPIDQDRRLIETALVRLRIDGVVHFSVRHKAWVLVDRTVRGSWSAHVSLSMRDGHHPRATEEARAFLQATILPESIAELAAAAGVSADTFRHRQHRGEILIRAAAARGFGNPDRPGPGAGRRGGKNERHW